MAQQLKTDIILNLAGNLAAKARQYGTSMSDFAKKNETAMTMIKRSSDAAGRGIDTLGNRYVGIAAAFATGATVRSIGNFSEQMTRLGTNAKLTDEQVATLKGNILELANQKDIRIDTTQFTAAVDELLGKTGDFEFVNNNIENMGLFMQAFGADAKSSGALFAQFREKGIKDAKEVMNVIDDLYSQFAVGSVNVKDLASISEQLFSVYQGKGPAAITQMASLVQLFAKTKGNANESLTSIQGVFAAFSDKTKVAFLDKQGIAVFKKGTKELREPVELLLEILDKAKNDPLKLGDVFDQTSLQGLASLYSKDNKDLLMQMNTSTGQYGETQKAAAKNAAEFNNAIKSLNTSFNQFAESRLSKPIQDLADSINSVDDKTIENWLKWGEAALWIVGGLVAAKKGLDLAGSIKNVFGSNKPGKGGKGGFADMGVMPVYVVNMGAGGMGTDITDAIGGKNTGANPAKTSRFFNRQTIATLGAVGLGISMADDFSPINVRRKSEIDSSELHGITAAPGLLDVLDDFKSWFSSSPKPDDANVNISSMVNGINGQLNLKLDLSDSRPKLTATRTPPGITIDPDTGIN